ncbi:MAG: hypothetical protein IJ105_02705 [Bacilli bacterium]|nr:hypothetical protein [Bacilli bacterium]
MEDVIRRLQKFISEHPEYKDNGVIQGLAPDGKIAVMVNTSEGVKSRVDITIDQLESGYLNQNVQQTNVDPIPTLEPISNQTQTEEIEVMDEVPSQSNESIETLSTDIPSNNQIITLKDMQNAVLTKDEKAVDKALETFALDTTNRINMNKAIKIVTDNCIDNVISSVRDNVELSSDLSKYDITGKPLTPFEPSIQKEDLQSLIDKSFSNILVYVEASRLKNIVYNESQIQAAKKKYATSVQDKINVLGLNQKEEQIVPDNVKEQPKEMTLDLQPDKNIKKAGFADILILTIIVLIYAAIIINLITKLK